MSQTPGTDPADHSDRSTGASASPEPQTETQPETAARRGQTERRPGRVILIVALALALVLGLVALWWLNREKTTGGDVPVWSPTPSASPTSTPRPTTPKPTAVGSASVKSSAPPPAPGCMAAAAPITPAKFSIADMKVDAPVLSLGTDSSGAPAAPPKNASHTVGWWTEGPKIGASKGNAILTIHTYRNGGALGNELNASTGLKPGMVVRLSDSSGKTMCYKYERALKIWVKDYDPNSNVLFDDNGKPQAVIVICWDFNRGTEEWDSRILYYLTPMS